MLNAFKNVQNIIFHEFVVLFDFQQPAVLIEPRRDY